MIVLLMEIEVRGVRCRTAVEFETNFEGLDVVVTAAAHHAAKTPASSLEHGRGWVETVTSKLC